MERRVNNNYCKSNFQLIDYIYHQGLIHRLGSFRTSPVDICHVEAEEPYVNQRCINLVLQYVTKFYSNESNHTYRASCVFAPYYEDIYNEKSSLIPRLGLGIKPFISAGNIWTC